jgi:hypothetical protein
MKLPHRRITRSVGVAIGALLVSGIPAISATDPAAATPAPNEVDFYTPIAGDTVHGSTPVHFVLGAGSDVVSVQLEYSTNNGASWMLLGSPVAERTGGVFEATKSLPVTGSVDLQAIGYGSTGTTSQSLPETVTLSSDGTTFHINPAPARGLGVFGRNDGHWFTVVSGTTSGSVEPHAVDAANGNSIAPVSTLPLPTGTFSAHTFKEPVDVSATSVLAAQAAIRVSDGTSSDATATSLYQQVVTAVKATATPIPGTNAKTISATVTDQYGLPVVGAPVRLGGHVAGVSSSPNQLGITNALGQVTFPGAYSTGWYDVYADLNVNANHGGKEPGFQVIVGTVSYAAPGKAFYHSDKPIKKAGGVYADAVRGTRAAAAAGYTWIDQDGQLAYKTTARLRAGVARVSQASDLVWVNAHGSPFNPKWLKKKKKKNRFEDHPWSSLKKHAGLRDVDKTFRQNAARRLSVEWEVKDVHPFSKASALDAAFANLATAAQTYYGAAWADRVQVKVLSNLHGGQKYALKVLKHAHKFGFTTLFLARGQATHSQIPAAKQKFVTYVRGAQAGYYPAIPVPGQSIVVP